MAVGLLSPTCWKARENRPWNVTWFDSFPSPAEGRSLPKPESVAEVNCAEVSTSFITSESHSFGVLPFSFSNNTCDKTRSSFVRLFIFKQGFAIKVGKQQNCHTILEYKSNFHNSRLLYTFPAYFKTYWKSWMKGLKLRENALVVILAFQLLAKYHYNHWLFFMISSATRLVYPFLGVLCCCTRWGIRSHIFLARLIFEWFLYLA